MIRKLRLTGNSASSSITGPTHEIRNLLMSARSGIRSSIEVYTLQAQEAQQAFDDRATDNSICYYSLQFKRDTTAGLLRQAQAELDLTNDLLAQLDKD